MFTYTFFAQTDLAAVTELLRQLLTELTGYNLLNTGFRGGHYTFTLQVYRQSARQFDLVLVKLNDVFGKQTYLYHIH